MTNHHRVIRRRSRGANLAILCAVGALIVSFLGLCVYSGLQTFIESDLQRASMNAAMAGAAAYYGGVGTSGKPSPDSGLAISVAKNTFSTIVNNSSLKGFKATLSSVTNNDNNDSITVTSTAEIATGFLKPIGIDMISTTAKSTARALKYEPTRFTGSVTITPVAGDINSYNKTLKLAFPLVDGPGSDLYVEQDAAAQAPYVVEGCNASECYSLVPGATPVGSSKVVSLPDGTQAIMGTAMIDLARASVRKASSLRFVSGNDGSPSVIIRRVMLFGYAGMCVDSNTCPVPAGFAPVE